MKILLLWPMERMMDQCMPMMVDQCMQMMERMPEDAPPKVMTSGIRHL